MKYKYYTAQMACRDNVTRTITITTDATDNDQTKALTITACNISMDSDNDVFSPIRPTTGTVTILCTDEITPLDFMPSSYFSHEVTIAHDSVCEFHGYINCETRTQNYPTPGEEFDISLISPLGLAESIRFAVTNPLSPHNIPSNNLDQILWLITDGYRRCGGHPRGNIYTHERFMEKIPRFISLEDSGDNEIDEDMILKPRANEGRTYASIFSDIARFYGITLMEQGLDLIAVNPLGVGIWWSAPLSTTDPYQLQLYKGSAISSEPRQLSYGTSDIDVPPSRVTVDCVIDSVDSILDFDERKLYRPIPIEDYTDHDFTIEGRINVNNAGKVGFAVQKLSAQSVDGNMSANTLQARTSDFDDGGSFVMAVAREQNPYVTDVFDNAAPSGLMLVSSTTRANFDPEIEVGTIRSNSYISSDAKQMTLTFSVAAMVEINAQGNRQYMWHPSCNPVSSCGRVEVRIHNGDHQGVWTNVPAKIKKTEGSSYIYYDTETSAVECYLILSSASSINGPLCVDFRCLHDIVTVGAATAYCTKMFIYNVAINANQSGSIYVGDRRVRIANPNVYEGTFRYSQDTKFNGEPYNVELPFSVKRKGFTFVFQNGIFDHNGLPLSGGSTYEKNYLDRIFSHLAKPLVTYHLPVKINEWRKQQGTFTAFVIHDEENYFLTGYSRSYMDGIDEISITKI